MASGVEVPLKSIYHIPHQQQPPVTTNGIAPAVTLTVRLIMQGKEVGSIIGKKGDNIKKFREESGAKINISDGSSPERIVTVTGSTESILKAFSLVAQKFEDDLQASVTGTNVPKPPVTLRLIVPASQCGSLIGKGGSKIKDIREATGASIQVASDMLPNSTERAVTISGTAEALTKCIYQICCVMMESPPKGATIPYRPKQAVLPLLFSGAQAYAMPGQYALPHPDLNKLQQLATLQHASTAPLLPGHSATPQAWASLAAANSVRNLSRAASISPTSTAEMTISNELIGCIIGKGGTKINEIRQISGAIVKVSNTEEGSKDRTVTITGTPAAVNCAQYLINANIERHKTLDPKSVAGTCPVSMSFAPSLAATQLSPLTAASLGQLVKTTPSPLALGLAPAAFLRNSAAAALFAANFKQFQAKNLSYKLRTATATAAGMKKEDRNKFSPY
ncbi:poly(rC)-binding protein 3 isoform X2 [Parasteatoda tepidariorum]|nr:poly(rC)-binding protein 3 isoform X2 [Parasteatoda tepidariorum]XP_042906911.1 poly(rC)-binding protein 3 isoform X2 [Parasteatoda tepidariorum]XP_042906912.1 poly(rC)-binding protein 3 isoform X2 [Parasteatoda tepidariorum]